MFFRAIGRNCDLVDKSLANGRELIFEAMVAGRRTFALDPPGLHNTPPRSA
jgi:hypothetical protein